MAIKRLNNRPEKPLSAEQKVAFAILLVLGFGGVFFGAKSFGANLMRPVQQQIAQIYETEPLVTTSEREAIELEESKSKDTDGDGLMDYDELYVFKTSPYLLDSDSDGIDDKTEVYDGQDPNCPVGQDCGVVASVDEADNSGADISGLVDPLGTDGAVLDSSDVIFDTAEDIEAFFQQATISEIRSALLAAGMTEEELALIDDETLQAYFLGTLELATESGDLDGFVEGEGGEATEGEETTQNEETTQ
jgi:hypothetical protein